MHTCDPEKTTFGTLLGNIHYPVMFFVLKNARVTYQGAMIAIFHNTLHNCLEGYIDDIGVKLKKSIIM